MLEQTRLRAGGVLVGALLLVSFACGHQNEGRRSASVAAQTVALTNEVEATTAHGDWPHWRGPNENGISRETNWSVDWPEAGPPQLWNAKVGTGFSTVSVVGDKLYTMGHAGDDDTVFCFNAETGSEIWKYSYPCKLVDNLHEGGPALRRQLTETAFTRLAKKATCFVWI